MFTHLYDFLDAVHARREDKHVPLRVVVPAAGSQPDLSLIVTRAGRWNGIHLLGMHYTKDYSTAALRQRARGIDVTFFSPFMAAADRAMKRAGVLETFDRPFGRVGDHYRAAEPHAIITEVSSPRVSPDTPLGRSWVSMGASADYTLGLIKGTDIPLAVLVNERQPRLGGNRFDISRATCVDVVSAAERPVYVGSGKAAVTDPVTDAIAANIIEILDTLPDGHAYQFGVGAIPNAIIERAPEGKIGAFSTEVLTPAMRGFQGGHMTGTLVLGDKALLDWVDGNPNVSLMGVEHTNLFAPSYRHVVSINQAMAVTLEGSAIVGVGNWHSGVGGSSDFGTNRRGTRILVLRSTHKGESTIVLNPDHRWRQFSFAAAHHPDYVVTENGWVNLNPHRLDDGTWFMGTSREIAVAIASIAAPRDRTRLDVVASNCINN